ncbi:MAG: hypothetical protein J7L38_06280 [Thermoproteales archaeon]|nr:hypothetical protein [Thermoproteales archaeon]
MKYRLIKRMLIKILKVLGVPLIYMPNANSKPIPYPLHPFDKPIIMLMMKPKPGDVVVDCGTYVGRVSDRIILLNVVLYDRDQYAKFYITDWPAFHSLVKGENPRFYNQRFETKENKLVYTRC